MTILLANAFSIQTLIKKNFLDSIQSLSYRILFLVSYIEWKID
jgi:hypothetical protein